MDSPRQDNLLPSALGAIGNTPLVELSRLTRGLDGSILAKLEFPASILSGKPIKNPNHRIQGDGYSMSDLP